ncbi:hypothetical protein Bca101_004270 [Brassica carinata]
MSGSLMNLLSLCFKPFGRTSDNRNSEAAGSCGSGGEGKDGLLWFRDLGKYRGGEFSMAVIQANQVLEDQSQIESGNFGTFVGVYDGHGGPEAARYVCDHLFNHFRGYVRLHPPLGFNSRWERLFTMLALYGYAEISAETQGVVTIQRAFNATEEGFASLVSELWSTMPNLATVGTCCLVGVIYQSTLFVASLGDSRVVLGKKGSSGGLSAIQLSSEHNANNEDILWELKDLHPDDPQIVVFKHGVWRVKGDMYMKRQEFNREPIGQKFRIAEPMKRPLMSATPTILSHPLHPNDLFLIFASDGLWEHLSNEKAGSAKRLIKAALQEAARKREMRYSDLKKIDKKVRRHFHDDITVIVVFLNHDLISRGHTNSTQDSALSVRSALEH